MASSDQTTRKVIDLIIALSPLVAIAAIQYRDEIARARMWIEAKLNGTDTEGDALRQVQKEISMMEHGQEGGGA